MHCGTKFGVNNHAPLPDPYRVPDLQRERLIVMTALRIKQGAGLTAEQAAECYNEKQKQWWIAKLDDLDDIDFFVSIGYHPAIDNLYLDINLVPGRYLLGCGVGRGKYRRYFEVDLIGYKFIHLYKDNCHAD